MPHDRVSVQISADHRAATVRIRATNSQRWADSVKSAAVGLIVMAALTYFGVSGITSLIGTVALAAGIALVLGAIAYVLSDETVLVDGSSIRVTGPSGSCVVSRAEQAAPEYSRPPRSFLGAQRAKGERGSGVLHLGSAGHGVRFGSGLTRGEAELVLAAFEVPVDPAAGSGKEDGWPQKAARLGVAVAPFLAAAGFIALVLLTDIPRLAAIVIGCAGLLSLSALIFYAERALPTRVVLKQPTRRRKQPVGARTTR